MLVTEHVLSGWHPVRACLEVSFFVLVLHFGLVGCVWGIYMYEKLYGRLLF